MSRMVCTEVYQFAELNDNAKEKARDWWRENGFNYDWWENVYELVEQVAPLLGINISDKRGTPPQIIFQGFCSQGDGACFEGTWSADAMQPLKVLKAEWPTEKELHRIHRQLRTVARKHPEATANSTHTGHYYHAYSTSISTAYGNHEEMDGLDADDTAIAEALRSFMDWIYRALEQEHDCLNSDANVDDSLIANDYEFTEQGEPV